MPDRFPPRIFLFVKARGRSALPPSNSLGFESRRSTRKYFITLPKTQERQTRAHKMRKRSATIKIILRRNIRVLGRLRTVGLSHTAVVSSLWSVAHSTLLGRIITQSVRTTGTRAIAISDVPLASILRCSPGIDSTMFPWHRFYDVLEIGVPQLGQSGDANFKNTFKLLKRRKKVNG